MLNYKILILRKDVWKVKVYLAEQITEYKVYWCLIKPKLLKLTQKSGFDNRLSVIWDLNLYMHIYTYTHRHTYTHTHTHIYIYTYIFINT